MHGSMSALQSFKKYFLCSKTVLKAQVAGLKFYYPKPPIDSSEWPESGKMRILEKQPNYGTRKPPRMQRKLILLRGPEPVHTGLIYGGYGVRALLGGRLKWEHFETIRFILNKKIAKTQKFAIWRVEPPWQPLCKKGIGKSMGGGKGSIHHYATPVKADRMIVELGGDVHEFEAKKILAPVCEVLPFPARVFSQKELDEEAEREEWIEKNNKNPFSMWYMIKNNMGGCKTWLSKYDYRWFGKYK